MRPHPISIFSIADDYATRKHWRGRRSTGSQSGGAFIET